VREEEEGSQEIGRKSQGGHHFRGIRKSMLGPFH